MFASTKIVIRIKYYEDNRFMNAFLTTTLEQRTHIKCTRLFETFWALFRVLELH